MPITIAPDGSIQRTGDSASPLSSGGLSSSVEPSTTGTVYRDVEGFLDSDGVSEFYQRVDNPLRLYNSHTYLITLGILNASEINNPNLYRQRGFRKIICRSGGGEYDRRQTTPLEDALGSGSGPDDGFRGGGPAHAEYFIENLELDAVVAPNTNTGVTLGHNLTFDVVEPYSMGKFLESCILAANDNNFPNYTDAPFCLRIQFVGYDEFGTTPAEYVTKDIFIPIIISKMDFEVTETGSLYRIRANAYSDSALQNHINQIKTNISVHGSKVHEVLETGDTSFTFALNDRVTELEERQIIKGYDRYVIVFPKKNSNLFEELQGLSANSTSTALTTTENSRPDGTGATTTTVDYSSTTSELFEYLREYARDESKINPIGMSSVRPDPVEAGDHHMPEAVDVYDDAILRGMRNISPTEDQRPFQARAGTRITDFIENVIQDSEWAADVVTQDSDANGFRDWMRIETKVFIEPGGSSEIELSIGRPRKIYVFAVYEFENHEARHLGPSQTPKGIDYLKNIAKKEYNYFYTGKNEDVLDFKINFNLAFVNNMYADFGQNTERRSGDTVFTDSLSGNVQADGGGTSTTAQNQEFAPYQEQVVDYGLAHRSGTRMGVVRARKAAIARTYHNRLINSYTDMINVEMDIWGDPYYLPSDQGNYNSQINTFGLSQDGTMSYLRNEVYVVVTFLTPLDYEVDGYSMTPQEASLTFSGVYQVTAVTNFFNEGKFTQTLQMIRIRGQNNTESTTNEPSIATSEDPNTDLYQDDRSGSTNVPASTPGVGGTGAGSTVTTPIPVPVPGNSPTSSLTPRVVLNGEVVEVGFGVGQVDPALARAAGGTSIGFGVGQVDPALARAVENRTSSASNLSGGTPPVIPTDVSGPF